MQKKEINANLIVEEAILRQTSDQTWKALDNEEKMKRKTDEKKK